MLSERLREVVTRLEQLPANEQDRMAELIAAELEEGARWQRALGDSHELVLDKLIAEAKEQVARGEVRDLDELL
jgi:hypothetical protein